MRNKLIIAAALATALSTSAYGDTTLLLVVPTDSWSVTNYYKQNVYDPRENKVGKVDDVLIDRLGKVTGLVIDIGGFLGMDSKDVIVPFAAVKPVKRRDKWWLTIDETKEDLKAAPGFKYDDVNTTWVPR